MVVDGAQSGDAPNSAITFAIRHVAEKSLEAFDQRLRHFIYEQGGLQNQNTEITHQAQFQVPFEYRLHRQQQLLMRSQQGFSQSEHIYEKQLRFLKLPVEGLASYYSPQPEVIKLVECSKIPSVFCGKVQLHHTVKCLPRLPSNNIMVVAMVVLQLALEDRRSQQLLNRIKRYAYDQELRLVDLVQVSQRGSYSEQVIKRLFVEFFHLVASKSYRNKVERFLYKYPIMQCAFVLLFRKILLSEGISDAGSLQLPVPTLWVVQNICKRLQVKYNVTSSGIYQISGVLLAEDSGYIYKLCEKQHPSLVKTVIDDEERILRLLDDSPSEFEIRTEPKSPNPKNEYCRPQTTYTPTTPKSLVVRPQSSPYFPQKNNDPFASLKTSQSYLPLAFGNTKYKSQAQIPQISSASYLSTQTSNTHILPQRHLDYRRSNSGANLLNIENNSYFNILPELQKQKSYQVLPQSKYNSFSPQRRTKYPDTKYEQIPRTTNPLAFFNQPLASRNRSSVDKRGILNCTNSIENYRYDSGNYQEGY